MPMQRHLYPDNWPQIAREIKQRAGYRCECCGVSCYRPGDRVESRKFVLTVAHLDHDPANCLLSNLLAMCAPCHLRYDAKHHAKAASATRRRRRERHHIPLPFDG